MKTFKTLLKAISVCIALVMSVAAPLRSTHRNTKCILTLAPFSPALMALSAISAAKEFTV